MNYLSFIQLIASWRSIVIQLEALFYLYLGKGGKLLLLQTGQTPALVCLFGSTIFYVAHNVRKNVQVRSC